MTVSRQRLGRAGEELAAAYLQRAGMRIVERNWRCARRDVRGELDLVAWDGQVLVFCEVKTRRSESAGGPLAAVTARKQLQLRRLGGLWLASSGIGAPEVRFDVVGVLWPSRHGQPSVEHLRGVC